MEGVSGFPRKEIDIRFLATGVGGDMRGVLEWRGDAFAEALAKWQTLGSPLLCSLGEELVLHPIEVSLLPTQVSEV